MHEDTDEAQQQSRAAENDIGGSLSNQSSIHESASSMSKGSVASGGTQPPPSVLGSKMSMTVGGKQPLIKNQFNFQDRGAQSGTILDFLKGVVVAK